MAECVRALAAKADVAIAGVFEMDMSRQSEKANAFFTGLGATKRIVLGDTLLNRFSVEEIEGVVAHELGHQVHGGIWRLIALGGAFGVGGAFLVSRVGPALIHQTAGRTGVHSLDDIAALPVLELLLAAGGLVAGPIQAAVSRAIKRRTDDFAVALTGNTEAYAGAMARLATQKPGRPRPAKSSCSAALQPPPDRRADQAGAGVRSIAGRGSAGGIGHPKASRARWGGKAEPSRASSQGLTAWAGLDFPGLLPGAARSPGLVFGLDGPGESRRDWC